MIIGLTGAAGSGKSTAAKLMGFPIVSFAGPIKGMVAVILEAANLPIARCLSGDLKGTPMSELGGRSPRELMQTLGTEWGRDLISKTLWTDLAIRKSQHQTHLSTVVIDDVRFDNEVEVIRAAGGKIIKIIGRGGIAGSHESENVPKYCDATIRNGWSQEVLRKHLLDEMMRF